MKKPQTAAKKPSTLTSEQLRLKIIRVSSTVRAGLRADGGGGDV